MHRSDTDKLSSFISTLTYYRDRTIEKTFLRKKFEENKANYRNYRKQRNDCVKLVRKSKRDYCSSLNRKKVCGNNRFWNVVKPCLSKKIITNENVIPFEGDEIINSNKEIATVVNTFFSNIMKNLEVPTYSHMNGSLLI